VQAFAECKTTLDTAKHLMYSEFVRDDTRLSTAIKCSECGDPLKLSYFFQYRAGDFIDEEKRKKESIKEECIKEDCA